MAVGEILHAHPTQLRWQPFLGTYTPMIVHIHPCPCKRSISLHRRRIVIKLQPFSHGPPQELRVDLILEASRGVEAE